METLRTPDERFADLPDWPWQPRYGEVDDLEGGHLRMHWIDEGPRGADPILLLHGEPTWGYLYRTMIPVLVDAGHRVVVPDLVGFGRSDKPARISDHTYARHVTWTSDLVFEVMGLDRITLFCQDWGGLIGLRLVAARPDRFLRVVTGNTGLPRGEGSLGEAFLAWQRHSVETPVFRTGRIVSSGCVRPLAPETIAAYEAPFPDDRYLAGPRIMPSLVPGDASSPEAGPNTAAWESLRRFERPWLCTFSDGDPVTRGGDRTFIEEIPGTRGQPHITVSDAGHFLQEDKGAELAAIIARFIAANPA